MVFFSVLFEIKQDVGYFKRVFLQRAIGISTREDVVNPYCIAKPNSKELSDDCLFF